MFRVDACDVDKLTISVKYVESHRASSTGRSVKFVMRTFPRHRDALLADRDSLLSVDDVPGYSGELVSKYDGSRPGVSGDPRASDATQLNFCANIRYRVPR